MQELELFKLENYLQRYLYDKKMQNSAKNTILTYSRILESFLEYYRGHYEEISLEKIDKAFIVAFLNSKALSSSSKNLYSTVLKNFFAYLENNAYVAIDCKKCFLELSHKVMKKDPEALSALEYEKVIAWLERESQKRRRGFYSYRNAFMIKLLLLSGIRASELLALKMEDFIPMRSSENKEIYKIKILGKGNKERYTYIAKENIEKELHFLNPYINTEHPHFLCSTKEGRVLLRSELYLTINAFLKQRGIAKRGVHMLRHSFGKHMVRKNVNLSTIKELMGHENIQTTMIYARSDEEGMIRAVV